MTNEELLGTAERLMALHAKFYELNPRAGEYDFYEAKRKAEEFIKALVVPAKED